MQVFRRAFWQGAEMQLPVSRKQKGLSSRSAVNEDGIPTGIDVELATEAFQRMGYEVKVVQINWEEKKELVESGEIDCIMGCFFYGRTS